MLFLPKTLYGFGHTGCRSPVKTLRDDTNESLNHMNQLSETNESN